MWYPYLVKKSKTLINLIIIESNWRKTVFFTDLLHGNSKYGKYQVKFKKELVSYLFSEDT